MWTLIAFIALLIPLVAVILDSQLGRALAARLERQVPSQNEGQEARVAVLEAEVERLNREVERLGEQSEFLHRLLLEKPAGSVELPSGETND